MHNLTARLGFMLLVDACCDFASWFRWVDNTRLEGGHGSFTRQLRSMAVTAESNVQTNRKTLEHIDIGPGYAHLLKLFCIPFIHTCVAGASCIRRQLLSGERLFGYSHISAHSAAAGAACIYRGSDRGVGERRAAAAGAP
eukprot:6190762-Pleurochrysis_carterae.AAC.1